MATLSSRGVPLAALLLNFAVAIATFLLMPFQEIVALNSSAVVLSFAVGPIAVMALRRIVPERRRPFRLPAASFVCGLAFVVSTLVVYWSGWPTIWRLGLCLIIGFVLFLIHARHRGFGNLDAAQAVWLLPYLAVIAITSYCGSFGGIALLPPGVDTAIMIALSIGIFAWASRRHIPRATFDAYLAQDQSDVAGAEPAAGEHRAAA